MTYVIAEAGTNYCSDYHRPSYAERFIRAAKNAGADAVKFQVFFKDEPLFCPVDGDENRRARWDKCHMEEHDWNALHKHAESIGIDMILSVFQNRGIEMLKDMYPRYIKVASRAAGDFPFDDFPERTNFLVSAGMYPCGLESWLRSPTLHCVMKYPCPLNESMWPISPKGRHTGLSDHSGTVWPGLDAIFRGAKFLEVHFNMEGFDAGNDAPVCLTTDQLKLLCDARDAAKVMRG